MKKLIKAKARSKEKNFYTTLPPKAKIELKEALDYVDKGGKYVELEEVTITENEIVTPDEGKAFSKVTVNVPIPTTSFAESLVTTNNPPAKYILLRDGTPDSEGPIDPSALTLAHIYEKNLDPDDDWYQALYSDNTKAINSEGDVRGICKFIDGGTTVRVDLTGEVSQAGNWVYADSEVANYYYITYQASSTP